MHTFFKMMTVQRQVGKLLHRSADASQVSVLLNDFEEADKMLDKVGAPLPGDQLSMLNICPAAD